jgi:hypothetical protein
MTPTQAAARTLVVATGCLAVGLMAAACGPSSSPSAGPTATVTVTAPPSTPAGGQSQTAAPTPSGPPGCATSALKASLGGPSGAAGSTYYPLILTNTSGSTCSLYGYPGVSFVTASGSQVGAAASHDPVYPRQLVKLSPGGAAHADLQVAVAQNYPQSTCSPTAVHRLKVYPPGQTSALFVAINTTACANSSVQLLLVQTVQPGSGSQ